MNSPQKLHLPVGKLRAKLIRPIANSTIPRQSGTTFFARCEYRFRPKDLPTLFMSTTYHKIPKISPGADIFQRSFLRGLYSEGLIYGGKFAFQNRLG